MNVTVGRTAEWFSTWFDSAHYHELYAHRNDDEAARLIDGLIEHDLLTPGSHVLDLGCGTGRHANGPIFVSCAAAVQSITSSTLPCTVASVITMERRARRGRAETAERFDAAPQSGGGREKGSEDKPVGFAPGLSSDPLSLPPGPAPPAGRVESIGTMRSLRSLRCSSSSCAS
jgi:SAM-dependent methyltransferase